MNHDLKEIAQITAKAKIFAASIPEGDDRQHLIPAINLSCEGIDLEIHVLKSPLPFPESMRSQSASRLAVMVEQLRGTLFLAKAWELAQEIGRARKHRKESGAKAGKAYGEKGGRPSNKPFRVDLQKMYDKHFACGNAREARASLVKELHQVEGVSLSTARAWLRNAGI